MKKILLYVVIAMLFTGCKYFEEKRLFSKKVDTLINYAEKLDESAEIDSAEIQSEIEPAVTETEVAVEPEEEMIEPAFAESGNRYHIITGCFMMPHFAESYAEKMQNMGYQVEIIHRYDGYNMVSVRSFNDLSASIDVLRTVRSDPSTARAWIYEKK
ncbi:MAG: hypothetical protein JSV22_03915 [Bacteroidales bacterium]|nr:MAG: hypothetical protein JSV22_03915 [Bacteroidales bacterium]